MGALWFLCFLGGAGGGGGGGVTTGLDGGGGGGGGGVGVDADIDTPLLPIETFIQLPAITEADDSSTDAAIATKVSLRFISSSFFSYTILTLTTANGLLFANKHTLFSTKSKELSPI